MSIQAMVEALELDIAPLPKFVAVALANCANHLNLAWPSVTTLSEHTSISKRGVQRWLRFLESIKAIEKVKDAGLNLPVTYRLNFAPLEKGPRQSRAKECPSDLRRLVISAFNSVCQYCDKAGEDGLGPDGRKWHVDRILAGSRGGEYEPSNVTLACSTCNLKKKAKEPIPRPKCLAQVEGAIRGTRFDPKGAIRGKRGCHREQSGVPSVAPNPSLSLIEPKSVENAFETEFKRRFGVAPKPRVQ